MGCYSPFPEDLPDPRIEPRSPALQVDALPLEPPGKFTFFFACSLKIAVGSLNTAPLPAGTMLPFASRGRRRTGSASRSRCAGSAQRTSQGWLLQRTWAPQAPASAELRAPLLLRARTAAVSSTGGAVYPLPANVLGQFCSSVLPWEHLSLACSRADFQAI